jgi:hypothetical protein
MSPDAATKALATLRIAIGAVAWLAPNFGARLFGLDVKGNPQAPYLGRLFGIRDVVLGIGALGAQGGARQRWLQAGLACDAADAAAAGLGHRDGYLPAATAGLVGAPAIAGIGLGVVALRDPNAQPPRA